MKSIKNADKIKETSPAKKLEAARQGLFKRFLKNKAPNFLREHSSLFDAYFQERFEKSQTGPLMDIKENPYAVLALGGYGRQEQCLMSDIDLLFLFEKKIPDQAQELVREFLFPLWDAGLEVGYATRSLNDCAKGAQADVTILTAMLDARFICGMSPLYTALLDGLRKKFCRKDEKETIARIVDRNLQRHVRFGDSSYLLEPNLKEGLGGLRDYHTMLWVARIAANVTKPEDFVFEGFLSHHEFSVLKKALNFIWKTRNHLHYLSGRKDDRLLFAEQIKMARILKIKKKEGLEPVELFLGELHKHMEFIKRMLLTFMDEPAIFGSTKKNRGRFRISMIRGLNAKRGRLDFVSPEAIVKSPFLLMKIFEESAALNIPLSVEARRLTREFSYLLSDRFRLSNRTSKAFENILMAPTQKFNVLQEMLDTGFMVQFIPEMKGIVNRIQYDSYHLYPVDKHLSRTVEIIRNFAPKKDSSGLNLCGMIYKSLRKKKLLLWGALLHDIGKGSPGGGHSGRGAQLAEKILKERGFSYKDVETVVFLVEQHLLLPKTASRRDINDEGTIISCARKIKTPTRLRMLYLLTMGDSAATGPNAWNEWSRSLIRELFFKILKMLEKGTLGSERAGATATRTKNDIAKIVKDSPELEKLDFLIDAMSPRYFLDVAPHDIQAHMKLYQRMGDADFQWDVSRTSKKSPRTVTICAKDRPGLMSAISGTFAVNGLEILEARAFTWKNRVALDIFQVKPPADIIFEDDKWEKAKNDLYAALSGELDLFLALEKRGKIYPPEKSCPSQGEIKIRVDNSSSDFFTIVEVVAGAFGGLLFYITDALLKLGLDVWVAKIGRKVDSVFDVFYVRDFQGEKADAPEQESRIIEEIRRAIEKKKDESVCGL